MKPQTNLTSLVSWIQAARPKTLPAAVSPVIVAAAAAAADSRFSAIPALAALAVALVLQIGVNLANDYFDYVKGIDTAERLGPVRVTQSGLIAPDRVRIGILATLGLASLLGAYLIYRGGGVILAAGLAAFLALLAYSGGPYPLASHGLGDLTVFIFFGPVAVWGTYYVQARVLPAKTLFLALPLGFLITAILVVNNLRDITTDRKAGKKTLAVMLGENRTRNEYALLVLGAYAALLLMWILSQGLAWILLPLLSLPVAINQIRTVSSQSGAELNPSLGATARLTLFFSLLLAAGLLLSALI